MKRKKTTALIIALLLIPGASALLCGGTGTPEIPGTGDYVILLHGLGRSSSSMKPLGTFLSKKDYHVINIDYPSRDHPIEYLVDMHLKKTIDKRCIDSSKKIHFVTHSLGGIVTRVCLKKYPELNVGRVVMLGPPNRGSEVADFLTKYSLVRRLMGPALSQLKTDAKSLPNSLGPPPCETGVIAGNVSFNWINSLIIPGPDDGKVSVKRARLEGMKDFLLVKRSHIFIMKAPEVMRAVYSFLSRGKF